ncbi:gliding motility-associated C-terminal domain-containing protein [Maribacter stanieri]|uniref:Gliding motility-associated C-terminal domain-containing protein n=2 Tax=Maribacter stanieri TaxID=440514 RepID=A0A1I6HTS4_9FLAO|nr:gliding motility-associated C-terminal domain-containing protein [Maribacter stanieri]
MTKLTSFLEFTKYISLMGKHYSKCLFFILFLALGLQTAVSQVKEPFQVRYEADIRGELTFIANNIVNRYIPESTGGRWVRNGRRWRYETFTIPEVSPNDPLNDTGNSSDYNDNYDMQYIDVDSDSSTFSSSSAYLEIPDVDCSLVRYAGLYWSAVYVNSDRSNIDDIKFRTPGGAYQDITADEVIFDGNGDADFGYYSPYAAYKDVTSIVSGLADPNGDYFVANVRASTGNSISGGISGGWKMVVVYENPNLPGDKFITTFDGYAGVKSGESIDIPVNGFTTLPAPFPVYANMGVAALEGDNRIGGDALQINANGSFTTLSNGQNPGNNFFNSSITQFDTQYTTRNPNSINTLGWDVDLFEIPNGGASNTIIPNGSTSAILRASSSQDKYDIFFTSFDVDIIAPNIVLEKRVQTPGGVDITGQGVHLGQTLDYILTFENIGNDDGVNYTIRDVLPVNVSPPDGRSFFNATDFTFPAPICEGFPRTCHEITYTYDPATREIVFNIPDVYVDDEDGEYSIGFRVQVAENCFDFINACSDLIENLAYSSYRGENNSAQVTDDPSVTDFNTCGFVVPGATNFLLDDLSDCNFERTIELCGTSAILNAGDGFDSYIWYRDTNSNGEIDATDIEINDGDPDNDPSTQVVTLVGQYIVDKIVADPCKGFKEIINVEPFGSGNLPNPVTEYFNEVNGDTDPSNDIPGEIVFCSDDSSFLPKIFLCGINDSQPLAVNIVDAQSVSWELLDEGSCGINAVVGEDCANKALTCSWTEVGTGSNYLLNAPGEYRLSVVYQNGCTSRFYFKGFQNNLDIEFNNRDIVCDTDGNITITNLGSGYGYQLVDNDTNATIVPFSANNGPSFDFASGENGSYRVEVTQLDTSGNPIQDACIFTTPVIGIRERAITYDVNVTPETCFSLGTINLQITDADAPYAFEIRSNDGTNGGLGTLIDSQNGHGDNNYTFTDVSAGDYIAYISTDDGCSYSEEITIIDENDLAVTASVSQAITCEDGTILMNATGGNPEYTYAIWTYVDEGGTTVTSFPSFADIPATNFQTSQTFNVSAPGDYTFLVLDRNGCYVESNTVTIEYQPTADFDPTTVTDVLCFGEATGRIQYNISNANGYTLLFTLFDSADQPLANNSSGNFPNLAAGDYRVTINQTRGAASCDSEETFTIAAPLAAISGDAVLVQDYTCLQDGIIEVQNVAGGTAPYSYSIDGINFVPDTTANANRFENLTDGSYTLTIRDANDCTFVTNQIVIDRPNPPTDLTVVESQITCPAQTANLTVNAINGTAPYVYSIIAPATIAPTSTTGNEAAFNGLAPDTYTVRVTDADGCFYDENYTINAINPMSASGQTTQPISCFGAADGIISFNVNFQAGQNFTYTVTGPTGIVRTGGTEAVIDNINGLVAGNYTIDIVDTDTNCTYTATHELEGPASALAISSLTEIQPSCTSAGSVSVLATGGWGSYVYELNNPDTTVFGSNSTGSFNGLSQSGTYNGTITDANNCSIPFTFDLNPATAPVLAITPNQECFDDAVLLTLTASVSSGGDGTFEYSLNGGAFSSTNVFANLSAGTYTVDVRDGNNCTDSGSITIDPALTVTASASTITACGTDTDIDISAAGGDGNYVYAVVGDGVTPTASDFGVNSTISVTGTGDYDVYVRDNSGNVDFCETPFDITIDQDAPLALAISNSDILCSGENQATLTIVATGGEAPITYSINNGTTYQPENTFNNLGAGSYNIRVRDVNNCEIAQTYTILEPFTLSASAAVTQLIECNPSDGAEVRVTNAQGGTSPYTYSFDGGSTYGTSATGFLLAGTHTIYIQDANNCTYPMSVTIDQAPTPPNVVLTPEVDYSCDGTGIVTITPDNPNLDYTYNLNGTANTPADSNVFTNVPVGTHTITVDYISNTPPARSELLREDFGVGPNVSITQIDPLFCYEPQDGTPSSCASFGTDTHIQDGEYSVTNTIINPYNWLVPNEQSGVANGRYLAINIGGVAGVNGVVYAKRGVEVIPNRDITIALDIFNLKYVGSTGANANLDIQLVDSSGNVITNLVTGEVPKSTDPDVWENYTLTLNPGAETNIDIVIRTIGTATQGNDVVIDNILAFQTPEQCSQTVSIDVTVDAGNAFEAAMLSSEDLDCNADNSGSITFEVDNYGTSGFEYSLDNFVSILGSTTVSPQTISGLAAGNYTVYVRDAGSTLPGCSTSFDHTISEPTLVVADADLTQDFTCNNGGAEITASATGGTPGYEYQLEEDVLGIVTAYQTSTVFSGLPAGTYNVRVMDANGCIDLTDTTIVITAPETPVFTLQETVCYSGSNDATILVDVTAGNGDYQFRINGGSYVTPAPVNATTYTFTGLSNGTYTVEVTDAFGCDAPAQTVTIEQEVTVSASASTITACGTDSEINITAAGGDGNYVYAVVANGSTPTAGDYAATNPVTVSGAGDYDVYVLDNNGGTDACSAMYDINIAQDAPVAATPTVVDVTCFGGNNGSISLVPSGGEAPYTYSINGGTFGTVSSFNNLTAGTYDVRVRDANNCEAVLSLPVSELPEIVAESVQTEAYTCNQLAEITVGGVTPTTGGSGSYQYSLNGGTWTAANTGGTVFTGLSDGTFTVQVRDANNISCVNSLPNIIIAPLPTAPLLSSSVDYSCDGTGIITILPNDASYTYSIDGNTPQTSNVFNNATVGQHTISVDYGSDCTTDIIVDVQDGNAFDAAILSYEDLDCNADGSGTITFEVENFGAGGYEYSYDSAFATIEGSDTAPTHQITGLAAGTYTIYIRDVDNPIAGCTEILTQTIIEPTLVVVDADLTQDFTCNNGGAEITASATGGTPGYTYQLEEDVLGIITAYQTETVFNGLPAGTYYVRARDANGCSDLSDTPIVVTAPLTPVFTLQETVCYSGSNDATIVVDVTAGNGDYQFRINSGSWLTPTPSNALSYTFSNLTNGTYTIDVKDSYGCPSAQQSITIEPQLQAFVDVVDISNCADGTITVTPSGGDGNYAYAFVPTTTSPTGLFGSSNSYIVTPGNEGIYDVYVRDNAAGTPFCEYVETVEVDPAVALTFTASATNPICHDGLGNIEVNVTSGENPFTIEIIDLDNGGASNQTLTNVVTSTTTFYNLSPGNYTINVRDNDGCLISDTPVEIDNPDELTADFDPILPPGCDPDPNQYGFRLINYPTTLGTLEFSANGGASWQSGDTFVGVPYASGTEVEPAIRVVGTNCRIDLPRYTIPYPLDNLNIDLTANLISCNNLEVTVQGTAGLAPYQYTYSEDPANFDSSTAVWTAYTPGNHVYSGLIPGRTYVFYVRDSSPCLRQSSVNVNDIAPPPVQIDALVTPTCDGFNNGQITYTVTENTLGELGGSFDWDFYRLEPTLAPTLVDSGSIPTFTSGDSFVVPTPASLPEGDYYVEIRGNAPNNCIIGGENIRVRELDPITYTPAVLNDITCANNGIIQIQNIQGGGGTYTYTLSSSNFTSNIVTTLSSIEVPISNLDDVTVTPFDINIDVTDQYGCTVVTQTVSMNTAQSPSIDSISIANCATPLSLTVNATGGTGTYLYSINGGTTYLDNGGVFNNIASGVYNVSIIDGNGCTDTDTVDVNPVLEADVSLTKLLDCSSLPDADITIDVNFGSGNYDYEISNGLGAVVTRTNLPTNPYIFNTSVPEDYIITIYDNNTSLPECNRVFTITVPPAVMPVISIDSYSDANCNDSDDGTITVSAIDSGISPFTFEIISGPGSSATFPIAATSSTATRATFEGLEGAVTTGITYTIRATAANGCFVDTTQNIIEPDVINNIDASVVEFGCTVGNNSNNATVTVDTAAITGGSTNYVIYEFVDSSSAVVQSGASNILTVTDRTGETYTINVYDDKGCSGSTTATVLPYDEMTGATAAVTTTVTCAPGSDGVITVTATSSASDNTKYEYSIDNGTTYVPTNVFGGLSAGNYNFLIRHIDTGCVVTASAIIEEPNTFSIDVVKTSDVVCFGTDTGEVTFELVDATYNTGFDWEIFRTDNTSVDSGSELANGPTPIINLGVGEYYVSISQANNPFCTNVEYFNIAGPDADITGNTVVTDITCVPGNDGTITITDVIGGWGGYTYYVDTVAPTLPTDFVANATFDSLPAGTYQAWVRDAEGCEKLIQDNIVLDVPDPIAATLQVNIENCTNLQGEIEVSLPTGGQGSNYTYQLVMDNANFRAPQNTRVFSGLGAGEYEVIVTDQWGCTFTTLPVELYEQLSATTSVDKAIDCTGTIGGTISINVTGGSTNLEFVMTPPTGAAVTQANNPIFTDLVDDGTYSFLIRDLDTTNPVCEITVTQELAPAIQPIFADTHIDITCFGANDGSITLTQTENGVNPLTFTISPVAGTFNASSNTFEDLPPNTYVVTATGTNDCSSVSGNIVIEEPLQILNVNADVVEFGCTAGNNPNNATITVDETAITGGSNTYVIYEFVDSSSAVVQSGASNVLTVSNRAGDTYTINVYDDKGCSGSTTATVLPFDAIIDVTADVTNTVTCAPGNDGELTVTVNSTLSDPTRFEYSIDNGTNYQASNVFGSLSAGSYTILARHIDTGCIVSAAQTIAEPNTFTINIVKTSDVICYGTATGAVNFELVDTTYPGGFTWTIYDTNGTLANTADDTVVISNTEAANGPTADINLNAGSYYVSITQDNNPFCTNTEAFTINGPTADISGNTVVTDITCNPGNDGSITITNVVGGWGGYTYYVGVGVPITTDFVAGATFSPLSAGTYQAWARDAEGCERLIQDNIVLDIPDPIAAILEVNIENCTNLQGEIEVSMPTGGQGSNYTYQLIKDGTDFRAPQNTRVFSGLGAGSYEVSIIDQWGCPFTTNAVVLYEQMDVSATVDKSIDCTVTPGGEITVNVTGGSTNLEFEMTTPLGSIVTQTTGVFTNLTEPGTYTFEVRDLDTTNPVCEREVTQTLDAPVDPVLLNATIVNVSCFGDTDGSIRANIDPATDDNPVYQYELYEIADLVNPIVPAQNDPLFTGLAAGEYQVRVISSRGCEGIKNETITEPTQLTVSAVATEFSCSPSNSVNAATITATAGAGTGTAPYLYSIDNVIFQSSNTFNVTDNGSVQTIDVYVKDANGCSEPTTVTIQPLNTFTATVAQNVAINCTVDETITITVADNGLAHNYGYELLPIGNATGTLVSTTATSATYDLNTVGSYVFRVTDLDTGCFVNTASYTVAPFDLITATATAISEVTCFGDTNGSLEIDIDGYTGNYNYEVFNTAGVSVIASTATDTSINPRTITGLSGGSYYVTITETDIPLCSEDTNIITIISPDRPLSGVVTPLAEATCTDDQGEIRVAVQGGYKPYDIVVTNTTTGDIYTMDDVNEGIFTELAAGDFTVSITDDAGCVVNYTETLTPATPIIANATPLVTDLACYGDTGAVVTANVTGGGSGTYGYQLNYYDATGSTIITTTGVQTNPNFRDLGAGFYSVTVVDGWNCDTTTNTVEVREPTEVQASLIRTDALTCATGAEFELTATGGSGTYEYSVDNINFLPMTGNVVYLPETGTYQAGRYQFYVRDAINGCESAISNAITESEIPPLELMVDRTAAVLNCTGESTAIIYASADGGLGNYQYALFTDSSLNVASRIAGPQSQGVFRDLGAGTYYVTVTSEDCETTAEEVIIVDPIPLSYTENVIDITCSGENDGEITVTLSGGAGGYQYAISPNLNQFYTEGVFTELAPGEYTVIAQDQNGCFEYLTYTISEPASLAVTVDTTPEICVDSQDGSIILEITGGTAPYSTALNSNDDADFVLNRTEFFDMAAGNYLIVIKDANGCDTNVVVDIETGVNLNATIEPFYECSGATPENYINITLEDDSVIGDVLYAIDSVDPAALQLNPDFRNTAPGNHYITIAHANGCIQTIDFVIEAFEPLTLALEQNNMNEITAVVEGGREGYTYYFDGYDNGDNNTFYITRTDTYEVRVVDENGCSSIANIFMEFIDIEVPNFFTPDGDGQNDLWIPRNIEQYPQILIKIFDRYGRVVSEQSVDSEGWDGTYLDNELPTGDYWYVVKLNGDRDEREFVGHFTLYR